MKRALSGRLRLRKPSAMLARIETAARRICSDRPSAGISSGRRSLVMLPVSDDWEVSMNAFFEHHQDSIRFRYRCFDRILLHGCIQSFLDGARAQGFFWIYRHIYPVSRDLLRGIATQYHNWVLNRSQQWKVEIVDEVKEEGRDNFVKPYLQPAQPDPVVVIRKARAPAGIMTATGDKRKNKWHLEIKRRWVDQYNFYLQDAHWGPMLVRVCPYFPFSLRICLNQHSWLAQRLQAAGIGLTQTQNAFRRCQDPDVLQRLADSLSADDVIACGNKWVRQFVPFFTAPERRQGGCWHRLFFAQVEYCDNQIFPRRAALDELGERLLDNNRDIGKPNTDRDLWPQNQPTLPGQTANRDPRPTSAKSGDAELLQNTTCSTM